jgi:hypothetical protein
MIAERPLAILPFFGELEAPSQVGSGNSTIIVFEGALGAAMRIGENLQTVLHIELVVRESAIVGYQGISPILRREPLPQAEENYVKAFRCSRSKTGGTGSKQ